MRPSGTLILVGTLKHILCEKDSSHFLILKQVYYPLLKYKLNTFSITFTSLFFVKLYFMILVFNL